MGGVATVFRRELAGYFATPVAYVFIVIFLVLAGALTFTLGNFFGIWGQPFNNTTLGDITGLPIVVYSVDDNVVTEVPDDEWNDIELTSKRQIVIQVGTPLTEIPNYTWTGD